MFLVVRRGEDGTVPLHCDLLKKYLCILVLLPSFAGDGTKLVSASL